MPGPEQQTEQTKEQKLDAAMQEITTSINTIREEKGEEGIHNINEMINREFLENIDPQTASDILKIIDNLWLKDKELPNDLKNLRDVLEPIAAQNIQEFWSLNNFTNAEQENLDKKQQKLVKEINSQISELTSQITDSSLKDILNQVNTIVTHLNNQNKEQLANFLTANWIEIQDKDKNDNTVILNWVNQFLEKIGQRIKDEKESAAVLNERAADAQQFWEFLKTIRALKWEDLNTYWHDRYLDKICTFIEHNPKNEDVIDAYIIMKQINLENESNIGSRDKTVFKDVFNTLNNLYWKKDWVEDNIYRQKAAQRYWDLKFYERDKKNISIVDIITTENGLNRQNWDGSFLQEDGDKKDQIQNLVNNMQGKSFDFDAKYFIENFNKRNEERINNNVDALKWVNIINILKSVQWDDILNKIEGRGNSDSLTIKLGDSGNSVNLNEQVLLELIWDYEFKPSDLPEWKWSFISDREIFDTVQLRSAEIAPNWLQQIANRPLEVQPWDDDWWWDSEEVEAPTQELTIGEGDINITTSRYWVEKADIIGVINGLDAEAKTNNADNIKKVIDALKSWNDALKTLQKNMQKELSLSPTLVPDWKFWQKTLYAMKKYIWAEVSGKETINYEVPRWRLTESQLKIYRAYMGDDADTLETLWIKSDGWTDIYEAVRDALDTSPAGRRKELTNFLDGKTFPWDETINRIVNNKGPQDALKSLQLQLVPYYNWHIDGFVGPLTVNAIENYVTYKEKSNNKTSGSDIQIEDNTERWITAENIIREEDKVIDKDRNHAYFLDGMDFDYVYTASKNTITAKVEVIIEKGSETKKAKIDFDYNGAEKTKTVINDTLPEWWNVKNEDDTSVLWKMEYVYSKIK